MAWSYSQSTGVLSLNGNRMGKGYSGNGVGMNNPNAQNIPDHGPIPQGRYTIGTAHTDPQKGRVVMPLTPNPANEMFGRDGFLIHGDNHLQNFSASEGCIILDRPIRDEISESSDRTLVVTT
jgi:hypothetical protein